MNQNKVNYFHSSSALSDKQQRSLTPLQEAVVDYSGLLFREEFQGLSMLNESKQASLFSSSGYGQTYLFAFHYIRPIA